MHRLPLPARPDPEPRPRPEQPLCNRYWHDGSPCGNTTANVDGWCREPECAGRKRSRRAPEHHIELVLETCTGEIKVLSFRKPYYGTNKQMASQIAHTLSAVGRNNRVRDLGYYRGRDPLNLLTCFPPRAHLRSVTMNRRHPLTGACEFISRCTFRCEHGPAKG